MRMLQNIRRTMLMMVIVGTAVLGVALSALLASGSRLLSVQSGSMEPAILKGDLVSVRRVPARDLRVGDVITFTSSENPSQTITHRIVAVTGDMTGRIVTKGDANTTADQAIFPSQIIGRVEHRIMYAGFIVDFIKQPLGLLTIIYLPALLVIVSELRQLAHYYRRMRPWHV